MKRSSDQMLAEFHRLYDIFEAIEDAVHNQNGTYWTLGFGRLIHSRANQLDRVAKGEFPLGEAILGTRQAINGTTKVLIGLLRDDPPMAETALNRYKGRTGRDFWDDMPPPRKLVPVILARGRILHLAEARLLAEWLAAAEARPVADSSAQAKAKAKAKALIDAYHRTQTQGTTP